MFSSKNFSFLVGVTFLLMLVQPNEALAYNFNVKVVNNSGQEITLWAVEYKGKGRGWKRCNDTGLTIATGSSSIRPFCVARAQKWQRQIKLIFACTDSEARRDLYFPRGTNKFYSRDHSQKNGNKYVTKIKAGECG